MSHQFKPNTRGFEVAEWFPERVQNKTCITSRCSPSFQNIQLTSPVLLAGFIRGELAATTAHALAHGGAACIIFTGRSQSEVEPAITHINRKHPQTKILFLTADTACLSNMREAARTIKGLGVPIDGIVCYPTVMAADWEKTGDGIESQFQNNYLASFVLVNSLLEVMLPGSRVVLMTTSVRREAPAPAWEDINFAVRRYMLL